MGVFNNILQAFKGPHKALRAIGDDIPGQVHKGGKQPSLYNQLLYRLNASADRTYLMNRKNDCAKTIQFYSYQ